MQKAYFLRFAYPRLYAGAVFDDYLQEEGKATHSPTQLLNVELIVCYAAVAIVSWTTPSYYVAVASLELQLAISDLAIFIAFSKTWNDSYYSLIGKTLTYYFRLSDELCSRKIIGQVHVVSEIAVSCDGKWPDNDE